MSTSIGNAFCPECNHPGYNVHWAGCSRLHPADVVKSPLTADDVRRIVREELQQARYWGVGGVPQR